MVTIEEAGTPWFARSCQEKEVWRREEEEVRRREEEEEAGAMLPPYLPRDPRAWSREEVCQWVHWTLASHGLPTPQIERFLMNGKAVCLMSVNMFTSRVPLGGKLLYRDFQIRLAKALHCKRG